MLDDLLETHTHFLTLLLERKRFSQVEGRGPSSFLIDSIGDILVNQVSAEPLLCNVWDIEQMLSVYIIAECVLYPVGTGWENAPMGFLMTTECHYRVKNVCDKVL